MTFRLQSNVFYWSTCDLEIVVGRRAVVGGKLKCDVNIGDKGVSRENVRKSHLHPFFFGVDFKTSFDFRINNMNLFDVMTYYAIIGKRIILLTTTQNFNSSLRLMAFKILFARSLNRMHPHVQKLTNTLLLKEVALRVILIVIRAVEV